MNTKLGEPWEHVVIEKRPNATVIATERPRPYRAEVPTWCQYMTMAVDTQEGHYDPDREDYRPPRHEVKVKAWGLQEESVLVYYAVVPATVPFDKAAAAALDEILFRKWKREDGKLLNIFVNAVDCGYMMDEAISYCQGTKRAPFCRPVHGQRETSVELAAVIISKPGVHQQSGWQFVLIGTRQAKNIVDRRLHEVTEPGPGFMHIPASIEDAMPVGYNYFERLMAERPEKDLKGVLHWERIFKANTGEPWDLEVFNLAAIRLAKAQYPAVKAFLNQQNLRDVEAPYEGEDRSAMAEVLQRAGGRSRAPRPEHPVVPPAGRRRHAGGSPRDPGRVRLHRLRHRPLVRRAHRHLRRDPPHPASQDPADDAHRRHGELPRRRPPTSTPASTYATSTTTPPGSRTSTGSPGARSWTCRSTRSARTPSSTTTWPCCRP